MYCESANLFPSGSFGAAGGEFCGDLVECTLVGEKMYMCQAWGEGIEKYECVEMRLGGRGV